jgi:hypothetical protein
MPQTEPELYTRKRNLRLGLTLLGIFVMLYAGSVIFILVSH